MAKSVINWFEIIAADLPRACSFYETIMGYPKGSMAPMDFGPGKMAFFPMEGCEGGVGGALWYDGANSKPGPDGVRVYLAAEGQIDAVLGRVPTSGGAVVMPKTSIGQHGFIALFQDSEGNIVGLHSMTA